MRKVRGRDTRPEMYLRKALWHTGLRYRVNYRELPGCPDVVFTRRRLAIFVDGEFWHGKKLSPERLEEMPEYWRKKIARNVERDEHVNSQLKEAGWDVLRIGASTLAKNLPEVVATIRIALGGGFRGPMPDGVELLGPDIAPHV